MSRALSVVALALLGGCFSQLTGDADITCDTLLNCPAGYVCDPVARVCRIEGEGPGCARDTDCPLAQICEDGACIPGCARDGDCGLGRACVDGSCRTDGRCNDSATCPFGQVCDPDSHSCVVARGGDRVCTACHEPKLCVTDVDCSGGRCNRPDVTVYGSCEVCGGGSCRYGDVDPLGCTDDGQCGAGRFCYRAGCASDAYCAGNGLGSCGSYVDRGLGAPAEDVGSCTVGRCVSAYCTYDCSDASGNACGRGYTCTSLISVPTTPPCATDAQCAAGAHCRRINERDATQFCTCLSAVDCPADSTCQDGVCLDSQICTPALGLSCEDLSP